MIFIIGVGRSGTSMLQSMLDSHTNVSFLPETQYIRHYLPSDRIKEGIEKKGIENFIDVTNRDENLLKDKALKEKWNEILHLQTEFDVADVFKSLVAIQLEITGKSIGGEKDAGNIDFIKRIKKYFPDSKVILIYRDPRDVVLSKTKASWSSGRPYWIHSLIGNAQLYWGLKNGKKYLKENFYTVKYEMLLNEPEKELTSLCSFLDIEYQTQMMNFHKTASRLFVAKRELQFKSNNFKPLIRDNMEKWKKELSNMQVAFIQSTNYSRMAEFGYEKIKIGYSHRIVAFLIRIINPIFVISYPIILKLKSIFKNKLNDFR